MSIAVARAAADYLEIPLYSYLGGFNTKVLPTPMMNIINGGSHSDAPIAFQEFMIVPAGAPTFKEALRWGAEIFHALKKILKGRGLETAVGDEGGFAPRFDGTEDGVETIIAAIEAAGYVPGKDVFIGFDCASSEFYDKERKVYDYTKFEGEGAAVRTAAEQIDYLEELVNKYPIITIEDGMDENDWDGWKALTERLGGKVQLVGDDFFVTNTSYLEKVSKKVLLTQSLSKLTKSVLLLKHSTLSKWRKKLVTLPLYHTVQVKLKIQQLLTSQLQQTQDKSRLVHFHVQTVSLNTTNCFASKINLVK